MSLNSNAHNNEVHEPSAVSNILIQMPYERERKDCREDESQSKRRMVGIRVVRRA